MKKETEIWSLFFIINSGAKHLNASVAISPSLKYIKNKPKAKIRYSGLYKIILNLFKYLKD